MSSAVHKITLLTLPEVVFSPIESGTIPNMNPSFPAVPSAKYYYMSSKGNRIPMSNTVGSPEEQLLSCQIWYSMKSDDVFPLSTSYAVSRNDQINFNINRGPSSDICLSMKNYLRQYPDLSDWFFDDHFQFIIGQRKRRSIAEFLSDFYRFPLNPESNAFNAARLLEQYVRDGDEAPLRRYLKNANAFHLAEHPFGYYPIYELFFLLTRFASYPMNEDQLRLSERRNSTAFNSPERIFIDAIFEYEIYDISKVLETVDRIATEGPLAAGQEYGANDPYWVNWADEYLRKKEPQAIEYIGEKLYMLAESLSTWTDFQIEDLATQYGITLPIRKEYPSRYEWVLQTAGAIKRVVDNS